MTTDRVNGFASLDSYAFLSDMRATALVAADGAVDWLALPALDAPPLCAALLDPGTGGRLTLAPEGPYTVSRRYVEGTMALESTYTTDSGVVRVTDCLNRAVLGLLPWTELARNVTGESGEVAMAWAVRPGHGLARPVSPWARQTSDGRPLLTVGDRHVAVVAEGLGTPRLDDHAVCGGGTVRAGESALLALVGTSSEAFRTPPPAQIRARTDQTVATWRRWSDGVRYEGAWRDAVLRSALTLKALTFQPSGAIAGAATTSLPTRIGGTQNHDYRFSWIRDSSYALDSMSRLDLTEELHECVTWMLRATAQDAPGISPFYLLSGARASPEVHALTHVTGYRGSLPVRVGNGAATQAQYGSYGDLFEALSCYAEHQGEFDAATNTMLGGLADRVCDVWRTPDAGFWELGEQQHYTSSKIGCWTALDRAVRLAESGRVTSPHVDRWRRERDLVHAWVNDFCWSAEKNSYPFYAGTDMLDAATLLTARTGFCRGDDPRLAGTVAAVRSELGAGGALLHRFSGQRGKEGAFLVCSAWLVEALCHIGRGEEAARLFEDFLEAANDLGLFSEQIDPESGEHLGNLPQTLTHLGVIGAATALADQGWTASRSASGRTSSGRK
jgi:GH15 family glucan-1,4-alpha-glucosidase